MIEHIVHVPEAHPNIEELPLGIYMIKYPESPNMVQFVYLWGGRLYTEVDKTLYVHSVGDLTSPSATYPLGDFIRSGLISENRLYLGGKYKLHIFEVTPSLTQPLTPVTEIPTKDVVYKILRVGDALLLG